MNKLLSFFNLQKNCAFSSLVRYASNASSALFVTGDLGAKTTSIIAPYIDLREVLKDPAQLQNNLKARNLSFEVESLKEKWSLLLDACQVRDKLSNQLDLIVEKIKNAPDEDEVKNLKIHRNIVREDLKFVAPMITELEKMTILEGLKLPNYLHGDTPFEDEVVKGGHESEEKFENSNLSHIEIGKKLDLLEFTNPVNYYLLNEAALFEIAVTEYFASSLQKSLGFINFSNADFCQSVIIEGVGHEAKEVNAVFRLADYDKNPNEDEKTFLVGGASLEPFCAYHCKNTVHASALPLRYVTQGRSYSNLSLYDLEGLYNVIQTNCVHIFAATADDEAAMMSEFNLLLNNIVKLYEKFNFNFRYSFVPASQLNVWECLRVSFQILSPYHGRYIEVGNLAISDDFISKRLRMHYHEVKRDLKFMKIISGSVVKVAPLLACILERNQQKFIIPECLSDHVL